MATPTTSGLLSTDEFDALLDAVQAHSRARMHAVAAGHTALPPYPLPERLTSSQLDQIPSQIQSALNTARDATVNQLAANKERVDPAAEQCAQGRMSNDDFRQLVEQQRENNEASFHDTMQHLKSTMLELDSEHPEWRDTILNLFQSCGDILNDTWGQVLRFLGMLVENVEEQYRQVPEFFKQLQDEVTNLFATRLS
jgi:flagellar biosynthesis chaperone FliJ